MQVPKRDRLLQQGRRPGRGRGSPSRPSPRGLPQGDHRLVDSCRQGPDRERLHPGGQDQPGARSVKRVNRLSGERSVVQFDPSLRSEFVKESDRGFQIANCEFIDAFEIRLYIHSQFVIRHLESIISHPLRPGVPALSSGPTSRRARPCCRSRANCRVAWRRRRGSRCGTSGRRRRGPPGLGACRRRHP